MKILLISGHGAGDPGATSQFGREADETIYMVEEIKKTLEEYAQVDLYPTDRNAYSDIKKGQLKVNFANYGYVFEVHFNACVNDTKGNGVTTGTEIFVTAAEKTVGVENRVLKAIEAFGLKNRGVKRKNYTVIARAKAAGVSSALLETCFIDDKDDMQIYDKKKAQIAESIAIAIAEQFGLKKNSNQAAGSGTQETKGIKVGSVVTIQDGAVYGGMSATRGKEVPAAQRGGKKHTVDKVQTNKGVKEARLKEIKSWVAVASLAVAEGNEKEIKAGSVVTIQDGAVYGGMSATRGKEVPAAQRGGKKHTVDKVQTNKGVKEARLKEINSWVAVASLKAV